MNRAGTLVLVRDKYTVESSDVSTEDAVGTAMQKPWPDDSAEMSLTDCDITIVHTMRYRNAPAGVIIGLVLADTMLNADARAENWIRAMYAERDSWIVAWLLTLDGSCDYPSVEMIDNRRGILQLSLLSE